jgi:broad specificity phosphatase PhoE
MPLLDPAVRSTDWQLDPEHLDDVRALRGSLPAGAVWFSSPEVKAQQTARLLTDGPVRTVDGLREQVRSGWLDDLRQVVDRAFAHPSIPAHDGWESLNDCRARIAITVAGIRAAHPDDDLVLVGHGTAWTVLVAEITSTAPSVTALRSMDFPDLIVL